MSLLTLLVEIYSKRQLIQTKKIIYSVFKDIDVKAEVLGVNTGGWLQISVKGEDEQLATNYLIKEIGACPENINNIPKGSDLLGQISDSVNKALLIDIGVFEPKTVLASISIEELQEQLFLDKNISLDRTVNLFGLTKGMPIQINILDTNNRNTVRAKLSEKQVSLFDSWKKSLLDRLIVQGSLYNEVEKAIDFTRLSRDIINIDSLGLFTQVLTCKLGTQAIGLIPRIGKTLKKAKLTVFNPKKLYPDLLKL